MGEDVDDAAFSLRQITAQEAQVPPLLSHGLGNAQKCA